MNRTYGWKPDTPDHRDQTLCLSARLAELPPKVDLTQHLGPVFDQGSLGSCTANAIGRAYVYAVNHQMAKAGKPKTAFAPSRLFIYYNERAIEGTISQDAGAMIRDGIKSINVSGVAPEKTCPYVIADFTRKPSKAAYKQALGHQALQYARVGQDLNSLKNCLASGLPIVFGFTVYESFESQEVARTGIMPMPAPHERSLGGHAVLCVGYDDATRRFKIANSWGETWGDKGYFYMPYGYLTNKNLADDLWNVGLVE